MNGYKTYRFRDKDPVIDELRTILQGAARIAGIRESKMWTRIARDTGMTPNTLWSWFDGPTRFPRHAGVRAVARALGRELKLTK